MNYQFGYKRTEREGRLRYQDTIEYKVVRTSEEPVELINGTQTGVYDVEFWQFNERAKKYSLPRSVQSDLTFEEATALRESLHSQDASSDPELSTPSLD